MEKSANGSFRKKASIFIISGSFLNFVSPLDSSNAENRGLVNDDLALARSSKRVDWVVGHC